MTTAVSLTSHHMFHKADLMDQPLVFHLKVKSSGYNKAPRQDLKHWIQWKNNFHLLQLEFTATQIVYKLVLFIRLVMFFFSEEPYLYLKQTLRSLLKKGQTEICESHHFKCFKKIIGTKFLPFFILKRFILQKSTRRSSSSAHHSIRWRQHWQQTNLLPSVFRWNHFASATLTIKCAVMCSI